MANLATVKVLVTPSPLGPLTATDLEPLVAAVPIDANTIAILGVTVGADNTTINAHGQVEREFQLNLTPAFKKLFPDASDQTKPFYGFMAETVSVQVKTRALGTVPTLS